VRAVIETGHINLVETLAEQIAGLALFDNRVLSARVRVEKLQVMKDAESVGVEIERRRSGQDH
jgi:dihydroneopterin aldolase